MNPKQFLLIGGIILLVLGIFGFIFPNPTANPQVLQFDIYENWIHTLLGIAAIIFAFVLPAVVQRWLTLAVGAVAIFFTGAGFALIGQPFPNLWGGANLENPIDNIIHLVVGIWGLVVGGIAIKAARAVRREERERMRAA